MEDKKLEEVFRDPRRIEQDQVEAGHGRGAGY